MFFSQKIPPKKTQLHYYLTFYADFQEGFYGFVKILRKQKKADDILREIRQITASKRKSDIIRTVGPMDSLNFIRLL